MRNYKCAVKVSKEKHKYLICVHEKSAGLPLIFKLNSKWQLAINVIDDVTKLVKFMAVVCTTMIQLISFETLIVFISVRVKCKSFLNYYTLK